MLSTNLTIRMTIAEEILHARMTNTIVMPKGALLIPNEADKPTFSAMKGIWINMVALPWETLHVL